jgi:hypothetical protein
VNALILIFVAELFVIAAMWHDKSPLAERKSKPQTQELPSDNETAVQRRAFSPRKL